MIPMCEIVASIPLAVNENLNIQKRRIQNGKSKTRLSLVTGTHGDELEGQYLAYMVGSYIDEHAILRFMNNRGIVTAKTPPGYITEILNEGKTKQIQSEAAGLFFRTAEIGKTVEHGDVLGMIYDPLDGELVAEIRTPVSGTVYFAYDNPLINAKTVCFKIIK